MVEVVNLQKSFNMFHRTHQILNGVSFSLKQNEILGLIGKSGCGKTTTAMCLSGLLNYNSGDIFINSHNLSDLTKLDKRITVISNVQYIFQNSTSTLNPKKRIIKIFKESRLSFEKITGRKTKRSFAEVMQMVNMLESDLMKFPSEFSGGEKQRINIARALLVDPKIIIADEPISSLDVTTQAVILNLLKSLKCHGISIIFITHDLAAAHYLCDKIAVMKDGQIIEHRSCSKIIHNSSHDYTKALIASTLL